MLMSRTIAPPALPGSPPAREWHVALLFAAAWALLPMLPALLRGEIVGSPYTDLYPSVWGLGWFAAQQPGLPVFTTALGAPDGLSLYFSSPLHGWIGALLMPVGGAAFAYDVTLLGARFATVLCAYGAFRAAGLGPNGGLAAAAIYGASPFFQGYAVEGIVEGTDGWALPLWAWLVLRRRHALAPFAFAAVIASSWYLGIVACLLGAGWGIFRRDAWVSCAGGLLLASPLVWSFVHAFPDAAPLPAVVRATMGAPLGVHQPGILAGVNPFAINTWIGLTAVLLALPSARARPALTLAALLCALLSLGSGPWYDLPVLSSIRFPYRWHAGTLFCLAPLAGLTVDRIALAGGRRGWIALVPFVEGVLFSPIEPILPGAPADVPAVYDAVRGPVLLEIPGPVAMAPGEINRSRPRARYLLYYQLHHGAASPWVLDFNGLADATIPPWLATWTTWDPLVRAASEPPDLAGARAAGVTQVMVHRDELKGNAAPLEHALDAGGARLRASSDELALYDL